MAEPELAPVEETPAPEAPPTLDEVATEVVAAEETETPTDGAETSGELETAPDETAGEVEPQGGVEKKIAKLTRKRREAERRADRAERLLDERKPEAPQAPAAPTEPQPEQYETYDDYIVAKSEFAADRRFAANQKQAAQNQMQHVHTQKVNSIIAKGSEAHEDFVDVTSAINLSPVTLQAISSTENGHEVAYHLGENPAEADRIYSLPPVEQVMAIADIKHKLSNPRPKAPSKAPDPITPVTSAGKTDLKYSPTMSDADYSKMRRQRKQRT